MINIQNEDVDSNEVARILDKSGVDIKEYDHMRELFVENTPAYHACGKVSHIPFIC